MGNVFKITKTCPVCDGDGLRPVYTGVAIDGEPQPPEDQACPYCDEGKVLIGKIRISQLDDILDKCNDIMDKCDDILDKCNDILEKVDD